MKAAVIICVISLSLCLSRASDAQNATTGSASTPVKQPAAPEKAIEADTKVNVTEPVTLALPTNKTINATVAVPEKDKPASPNTEVPTEGKKSPDTKPEDNKTGNKTETAPAKANDKPDQTVTPKAAGNETTIAPKPDTPKPVKPEEPKTTEKPLLAARGFDGPSFIGGIILALGLLAIGFMGFKYYKNQTERNYHTL